MRFAIIAAIIAVAVPCAAEEQSASEKQIRSDCQYDALRLCAGDVALVIANPSKANRNAVRTCMMKQRAALQPKCSRHLQ